MASVAACVASVPPLIVVSANRGRSALCAAFAET
jgi:hypothetical protein